MLSSPQVATNAADIEAQAKALAQEFGAALQGRTLNAPAVLGALLILYRYVALQLPPDAQGSAAMTLGAFAGDLFTQSMKGGTAVPPASSSAVH